MADIATLGLELDATGLLKGSTQGRAALTEVAGAAHQTEGALGQATKAAAALGLTFGAYKVAQWASDTLNLGARYETLGVTMDVVGKNAFKTSAEMDTLQASLEKTGISMLESRNNLARMASAELDLEQATKLARIAQDAAVIANENSSESFERLVTGITTGQPRILRTLGIFVDFNEALKVGAKELGKNADALSEVESTQIRANAVLEAGTRIAGAYEAAMGTAGKQLNSTVRYMEDMRVKASEAFQPEYTAAVFAYANALKFAGENAEKISGTVRILFALFAAKIVAEATARLSAYNATLIQTAAAHVAAARAAATANATELVAANTRLAAMQNRLRVELLLGASAERLAAAEQQVALAQTRVAMTAEAATASQTALATATTVTGGAMATTGALAKGAWAAIGGPIGAAVIGALAINAILDKYLAKMVEANELTAEELALWEKTQKIWAEREKLAAASAQAEKDRAAAAEDAARKAAEKAKEAAKEARTLTLDLEHQKALVAAFGQTTAALDALNLQYEERAALAKNAEEYSGADLQRLNDLTTAIYAQRQALADLEEQRRRTEVATLPLLTEAGMVSDVAATEMGLEKELALRKALLAATLESKAAVRELAIEQAGAAAAAQALAGGMPEAAARMRALAEEAARVGFALEDTMVDSTDAVGDALRAISSQLGGLAGDIGQVVVQFFLMAEAAQKAAAAAGNAFGVGDYAAAGATAAGPAAAALVANYVFGALKDMFSGGRDEGEILRIHQANTEALRDVSRNLEDFGERIAGLAVSQVEDFRAVLEFEKARLAQTGGGGISTATRTDVGKFFGVDPSHLSDAQTQAFIDAIQAALDAAAAHIQSTIVPDMMARAAALAGDDLEAARIRREAAAAREVAELQKLADAGFITAQQMEDFARVIDGELAQALEAAAEAARKATRALVDDLTARALDLTGQGGAAATYRLGIRQRGERESAAGESPDVLAVLDFVHELERNELATQQAIGAVNDGLNLQLASLEAQASATRDAYETQDAALADQIELAEAALRVTEEMYDSQIEAAEADLRVAEDQLRASERTVEALRGVVESLSEFRQGLLTGPLSTLSPVQQIETARAQFAALAAQALAGDVTAGQGLPGAGRTFLEASRGVNASGTRYAEDFAAVQRMVEAVEGRFGAQLTTEERILATLQAQTGQLETQIGALEAARDQARADAERQISELQAARDQAGAEYERQVAALERQMAQARADADAQIAAIQAAAAEAMRLAQEQLAALLRQIALLTAIETHITDQGPQIPPDIIINLPPDPPPEPPDIVIPPIDWGPFIFALEDMAGPVVNVYPPDIDVFPPQIVIPPYNPPEISLNLNPINSRLDNLIGWTAAQNGKTQASIEVLASGFNTMSNRLRAVEVAVNATTSEVRKGFEAAF